MIATLNLLQDLAVASMVVGAACIVVGFCLYGFTGLLLDLVKICLRHKQ